MRDVRGWLERGYSAESRTTSGARHYDGLTDWSSVVKWLWLLVYLQEITHRICYEDTRNFDNDARETYVDYSENQLKLTNNSLFAQSVEFSNF
jgi:hypothetical protein